MCEGKGKACYGLLSFLSSMQVLFSCDVFLEWVEQDFFSLMQLGIFGEIVNAF